jgi:hypothetical protein
MIDLPDTSNIEDIADWVEYYIISKNEVLSKAKIGRLLEIDDNVLDSVLNELHTRLSLYGVISPFNIKDANLIPRTRWDNSPELALCLIFSSFGVRKRKGEDDGTKLFERLCKEAIVGYLCGEAEVIGFPNVEELKQQIRDLSVKTYEKLGSRSPRPVDKDKGVDIIAWKPHNDGRDNQIVLLLQCGAGKYFRTKKAISIAAWNDFINWSAEPIKGIMVPCIVSKDDWVEIRDDYNMIFDRVRILRAVHKMKYTDKHLKREMLEWCRDQLN